MVPENIHTHHREGHLKLQGGGGGGRVAKAKNFKGKYEVKLEFPKGWDGRVQSKKTNKKKPKGGVWIFSETTQGGYFLESRIGVIFKIQ